MWQLWIYAASRRRGRLRSQVCNFNDAHPAGGTLARTSDTKSEIQLNSAGIFNKFSNSFLTRAAVWNSLKDYFVRQF